MKGITLKQDEVKQLQDSGAVTVWRDVKPQPKHAEIFGTTVKMVTVGGIKVQSPIAIKCPYATPGEARFARETFVLWDAMTDDYEGDLHRGKLPIPDEYSVYSWKKRVQYRASTECDDESYQWRASTTMPGWASRHTVTCSDVTVENRGDVWQWGIGLERMTK